MAGYCETTDLYIGDLTLGAAIDPQKYVDDAAREINSELGKVYLLPLEAADELGFVEIPEFTLENLKKLNIWLASGRLILAINATGGDDTLNAYGAMLVKDAQAEIQALGSGMQDLVGAKRTKTFNPGGEDYNGPVAVPGDATSAVDTFYAGVMGGVSGPLGEMPRWRPGV